MRVWVIKVGEPLPIDGARYRPHRIGMLSDELLRRGHEVTWWASTLDHASKTFRFRKDAVINVRERYRINLIHSMGYKNNVSLHRLADHAQAARKFRLMIEKSGEAMPDLIWCCFPTIELSLAAVEYGRKRGIPVVLDIRDLWPDNFMSVIPRPILPFAEFALRPYVARTREAFSGCSGLVGISEGYLQWALYYAGRSKITADRVFPLGYQQPEFSDVEIAGATAQLESMGVDPTKSICWFVGMFGKTYDLETVVKAAETLHRSGENTTQFVLSGSGESEAALRSRAEGLPNIVFTGRINAVQLAAMSRLAAIGLMAYVPGAPQGMPNKLFEYMCAGLAILSSLEGETETALETYRCGRTYRAGDPDSLVRLIQSMHSDPDACIRLGANGRSAFLMQFAAEKIYSRMGDYIEQLVLANMSRKTHGAAASHSRWSSAKAA